MRAVRGRHGIARVVPDGRVRDLRGSCSDNIDGMRTQARHQAVVDGKGRATRHVHAVGHARRREPHDHEIAQRNRETRSSYADCRSSSRRHQAARGSGNRQDGHRLRDVYLSRVVVGRIEHPDLSTVGDCIQGGGKKPARGGQRAGVGVVAVARKVGAEELGVGGGAKQQAGGKNKGAAETIVGLSWEFPLALIPIRSPHGERPGLTGVNQLSFGLRKALNWLARAGPVVWTTPRKGDRIYAPCRPARPSDHPGGQQHVPSRCSSCVAALAATLLMSATANAQIFRAYVASDGNDANPCTLPAPCRLLPAALAAVTDGGEIWMLDSANFNTATVTVGKSVTILAVPGAVGSVLAIGGPAISITTASPKVTLRNLVIVPLPGGGGTHGVSLQSASALVVEDCLIANHSGNGIDAVNGGALTVTRSTIRGNDRGVQSGGMRVSISDSKLIGNGYGVFGYGNGTGTTFSISDSVVSGGSVRNFCVRPHFRCAHLGHSQHGRRGEQLRTPKRRQRRHCHHYAQRQHPDRKRAGVVHQRRNDHHDGQQPCLLQHKRIHGSAHAGGTAMTGRGAPPCAELTFG